MLYDELAKELLDIRSNFLRIPSHQKISKLMQGESFVLNYLNTNGMTAHPKELSQKLSVSTARIASLLNHLEEKGLINRTADPEDFRQVIVQITPEGAELIQQIRRDVLEYTTKMLEELGADDAREYIRIQKRILHNSLV